MYTGSAARIYNPRPDPAERGPPKRVAREETHIGEMVAASKKRISWKFTLGESDVTHEVVLVHSIMSYKKVVEFDGRQMHYSATFTPGDWKFLMILEGSNHVFEVRINDLESAEVPKYDLAVDRIAFRRWDVYRRRKHPIATATYAQPNAAPQATSTFGTQRWGPSGMSAPPPPPEPADARYRGYSNGASASVSGNSGAAAYTRDGRSSSFGAQRDSGGSRGSFTGSPPYQQQQQQPHQRRLSGQSGGPPPAPAAATAMPAKKQPEINLIDDDFGPSVSVPAQTLLFDPLASSSFTAPTGASPSGPPPPAQQQQQQQQSQPGARASSSPAFAPSLSAQSQPAAAPFVDPFAHAAQTAPLQPAPVAAVSFAPHFAAPTNAHPQQLQLQQQQQQQQQQQRLMQAGGMYTTAALQQQPLQPMQIMQMGGGAPVAPMNMQPGRMAPVHATASGLYIPASHGSVGVMQYSQQQQQQQQQQAFAPAAAAQSAVRIGGASPVVNYSISQLMNPADVHAAPQHQQPKAINIDAFAGMS